MPSTGKPATSKREALDCESAVRNAVRADENARRAISRPGTFTLGQALVLHIDSQVGSSPVHVSNLKLYARELLEHFGADMPVTEIGQALVDEYRRLASESPVKVWRGGPRQRLKAPAKMGTGKRQRSPASVNHRLNCLRAALNQAHRVKDPVTGLPMLPFPPTVTPVPQPKRRPRPMPDAEFFARLEEASPWVTEAAELARYFGLRHSEALGADLAHVDTEHRALRFDGATTKSGRDEFAHPTAGGWELLTRLVRQARARGQTRLITWPGQAHLADFLAGKKVPRECWRPLKSIKRSWRTTAAKAELEQPHRLHDVRARYITEVAKADRGFAKEAARHADAATTELYIAMEPGEVGAAVRRVPRPKKPALRLIRGGGR